MSQAQIGNLNVSLGINTAQFAAGLAQAQGSLARFGSTLKTFAMGAGAITVFSQAVGALKQAAEMGDVAESIGISAEQLQVFNRLALASGTSTEVMTNGLQSIAEQSVDTESALSKLFVANGLTMAGKSMNQIVMDFMDLLRNAKTPAEQLAIATDVLGTKVGRNLVEAMRTGSKGWREEQEKMKQSGNYLADKSVEDAQRIETAYNQLVANIGTAWQNMVVESINAFNALYDAPNVKKVLDGRNEILKRGSRYGPTNQPAQTPRTSGMGSFGGPNEFAGAPAPVKITIIPPSKEQTDKVKKDIADAVTPPAIDFDTSVWDRAQQIIEETRTPLEQYQASLRELNEVYNAGAISTEVYQRAVQQLQDDFTQATPAADEFKNALLDIGQTISDSLGYAFEGLISGTMSVKDAFRSMTQSISSELAQLAAQLIKSSIFKLLSMLAGGMGGFTVGGMSFGGFYANGGTLGSGKWGIAGEAGPEIVHGPASITPMDKAGSQAPQMNVTVINNSSASVSTRKGANGGLEVMVEEMIADKLLRGGNKIDSALARGYGLRRAGR